jgi:hypothetical protein
VKDLLLSKDDRINLAKRFCNKIYRSHGGYYFKLVFCKNELLVLIRYKKENKPKFTHMKNMTRYHVFKLGYGKPIYSPNHDYNDYEVVLCVMNKFGHFSVEATTELVKFTKEDTRYFTSFVNLLEMVS